MKKSRILIIEDGEENIDILVNILGADYDLRVATNGERGIELAQMTEPDLILLDIMMPIMDGFQVCEHLKSNNDTRNIPIIFLTALSSYEDEAQGLKLGAIDFIVKPFYPELIRVRIKNHIKLKKYNNHLLDMVLQRTKELKKTQEVTIKSMGALAEFRDPETGGHINRTQIYVKLLLEGLAKKAKYNQLLTMENKELLILSAPLHDIGKVGVHDDILLKPGKLTKEEFEEMKLHTVYGKKVIEGAEQDLGENSFLRFAKEIAYTHHEWWDGTGYPRGLKGEEIPLGGRIMAVADVYDALISKRVYKPPFPHDEAKRIIVESSGTHLDPEIVEVFLSMEKEFVEVAMAHCEFDSELFEV